MEWYWTLAVLLGSILALMAIGMPVGLAFLGVNVVAASYYMGGRGDLLTVIERGVGVLAGNAFESMTTFALVPIPMFLLMGEFFFHTGLANRMFNAVEKLMGRVPARLSYVTVAGGTAFATLSGSSMGSTALLGTLMVPEMTKRGYKKSMSIGPILGTGGLAMLIPPSALAVLLGTLAELDIGKLLVAGIMPGLILAVMYAVLIYVRVKIDPEAAPNYEIEYVSWARRARLLLLDVLPMVSIVIGVIMLIMFGVATPSEAAAFGCLGVVLLAVAYRCLTIQATWKSLEGAGRVTIMALLIIFGSSTFSQILSFSGGSNGLILWVTGFDVSPLYMLLVMFGILLILGMFMDQLSMMLLTVPIFFPLAQTFGFDLIWFGVIILLALEISFTTPPFGLLLFVMQGVAPPGTRFSEICLAAIPFMLCAMTLVALIVVFPEIATWLPSLSQ
ncbi:MAG: TRAP transporter large permease [Alphaproteobacteria bacterium]|jgi:tripartite ATP-independent transporter DctM subunit|nr:C4-dicarboxylate ABC transporter permease [Rhodospirillaceae bacterium]MDP6407314.1 TRAP transporter large permease [Alphaproteobacteria bacterium]MDP6621032.1 TRAP transporter large permease [Alphaproteobacteria bacterium]|tara:strand:- start:4008 stop:5345 length:1338 start_codon:yes stop_codon:yes gene_type:complete